MEELIKKLALQSLTKIPAKIKKDLISAYGNASKIFESLKNSDDIEKNFGKNIFDALKSVKDFSPYKKEIEVSKENNINVIEFGSPQYPELLTDIVDPPLILFQKGRELPDKSLSIAVVGARKATRYGLENAARISKELAQMGINVISGLALGIDAVSHDSCLKGGGHTVAVLGCGINIEYPKANSYLFGKILEKGTVITEFGMDSEPRPENFPQRNRIISGLSHGVLIVEAALKSGARITARLALEQNREVFAVPGNISSALSEGTNFLIKNGLAKLTVGAEDIIEEFEHLRDKFDFIGKKDTTYKTLNLSEDETKLFSHLRKGEEIEIEFLARKLGLNYESLLDIILRLELKGIIVRKPGNMVTREI